FIGPTAEAIDLMGNKAAAKRRMIAANVPCVPGYEDPDQSDDVLAAAARDIGFPVMVKAAAGGGGRGMRLVHEEKNLIPALESARSEALNAFGSDELILEKAIIEPRHVEVQIFADTHGNVIHLGERDCSVQRRHQKVVEEAPCPVMTPELRQKMGAAAVEAARNIKYRGAGTVEFLLDASNKFYFLEMNTRLQVEHPVTELVTGLDLVSLQIQVAEGAPLGLEQSDISLRGHAIEVRLYAEDTTQDFLPCTGRIEAWEPATGDGIRFDSGIDVGQEISPFYDPMIAKVIAYGESREMARHRLIEALKGSVIFGLTTNRSFLIDVLAEKKFAKGEATTAFIGDLFDEDRLTAKSPDTTEMAMAAVLLYQVERDRARAAAIFTSDQLMDWSSGGVLLTRYVFEAGEARNDVTVSPHRDGSYHVMVDDKPLKVEVMGRGENRAQLTVDGKRKRIHYNTPADSVVELTDDGRTLRFVNTIAFPLSAAGAVGSGHVVAPMHGTLLDVFVKAGDTVEVGTRLAVLEAMKMQHDILAEVAGMVEEVIASAASQVSAALP
ncbi:MAG: biotin/lipoyl-containing protein, partial [Sneathiella sp.]